LVVYQDGDVHEGGKARSHETQIVSADQDTLHKPANLTRTHQLRGPSGILLYVMLSPLFSHSRDILGTLCGNIRIPKFGIDVPDSQYDETAASSGTVTLSALEKVVEFGSVALEVVTIMKSEGEQEHMSGRHDEI
jgi:hypothetical protein